jgi:hypothetical protein
MASTRRTLLTSLLGLGMLTGLRGGAGPLIAAAITPPRLPETSLRLERVLEREVGAGALIRVRRSWEVFFERLGRGISVTGRQTGAEVSAPPNLAALARIEQQRDTSAMFPLLLGEDGMILSSGGTPEDDNSVAAAMRMAETMIARQPVPEAERDRNRFYLAQVHAAGSNLLDTFPSDLLFPLGLPVEQSEAVTLPDGLIGRFTLSYHARPQGDAPWLAFAERRVQSEVGGLVRRASETWTLGPVWLLAN